MSLTNIHYIINIQVFILWIDHKSSFLTFNIILWNLTVYTDFEWMKILIFYSIVYIFYSKKC